MTWMSSSHQHWWCWSLAQSLQQARRLPCQHVGSVPGGSRNGFTFQDQTAELPKLLHLSQHPPYPPGTSPLPFTVPSTSTENCKGKPAQSSPLRRQGLRSSTKRQVCAEQRRPLSHAQRVRLTTWANGCQSELRTELSDQSPHW